MKLTTETSSPLPNNRIIGGNEQCIELLQIFYDDESSKNIADGFIGLDNTKGPKHLFESFPIHKYLTNSYSWPDQKWLGFFSPKFFLKTNLTATDVKNLVVKSEHNTQAYLFSSMFDEASLFPNVWVHGEGFHPGLMNISQKLANNAGYNIDLKQSFSCLHTAVFSHYLVAKSTFWREWLRVVNIYFDMLKTDQELAGYHTMHKNEKTFIHAFVIERIPTMVLIAKKFKSDFGIEAYDKQIPISSPKGATLIRLDHFKKKYLETFDQNWREKYAALAKEYVNTYYDNAAI